MFSILRARLATGMPQAAASFKAMRVTSTGSMTRSSILSVARAFATTQTIRLPTKAKPTTTTKASTIKKAAPKKKVAAKKKPVEQAAALKTKVVKKADKVILPRGTAPPKRGGNAFSYYLGEQINSGKYGKLVPGPGATEIFKQVADSWRGLTLAEKQPYAEQASEGAVKARQALIEWFDKTPRPIRDEYNRRRVVKHGNRKIRKPYDPTKPKKPASAFLRFMQETKTDYSDGIVNIARSSGAAWNNLSDAQKKPYLDAYKKDWAELKQVQS